VLVVREAGDQMTQSSSSSSMLSFPFAFTPLGDSAMLVVCGSRLSLLKSAIRWHLRTATS
jgi:hypothetical protein